MYITYWSDLHIFNENDFNRFENSLKFVKPEFLILAGDLIDIKEYHKLINTCSKYSDFTIIVLGNHEFWGNSYFETIDYVKSLEKNNVKILHNDTIEYNGIKFAGTTLFTDITGCEDFYQDFNDFKFITDMTFDLWMQEYNKAKDFIINSNADIVITHHAPFLDCVDPKFIGDKYNKFFINDLEHIINKINKTKVWIHGHIHNYFDFTKNGIDVKLSAYGYFGEYNHGIAEFYYKFKR